MKKFTSILISALIFVLMLFTIIGCTDDEDGYVYDELPACYRMVIDYARIHGEYNAEKNIYSYFDSNYTNGGLYRYFKITYHAKTNEIVFSELSLDEDATVRIEMAVKPNSFIQNVSMSVKFDNEEIYHTASGTIYSKSFSSSNHKIHSFTTDVTNEYLTDSVKSIFEDATYLMLVDCQLLLIDAGTGLVPFGFENIWN